MSLFYFKVMLKDGTTRKAGTVNAVSRSVAIRKAEVIAERLSGDHFEVSPRPLDGQRISGEMR